MQEIDLDALLDTCLSSYQIIGKNRQLSLICDRGSAKKVFTDERIASLILDNLLSNAVNYTPSGGKIEISIALHSPGTIRIQNYGAHMQFNEYTDSMPVKYVMEAILDTTISRNQKLRELIEYFEFGECLKKKYSKLSGGQKQRLTIILVMMQEAPMTFYDEVTSGLDFETRQRLMEKELAARLLAHNKNYKRSNQDIEILSINAKETLGCKKERK